MGNSKLASSCHLPSSSSSPPALAEQANGILGRVQGQYISDALATLPDPATDPTSHHVVEIDAGHSGRVRLLIEKKRVRHRRHSHYFWSAYRAEPVRPDDPV